MVVGGGGGGVLKVSQQLSADSEKHKLIDYLLKDSFALTFGLREKDDEEVPIELEKEEE